MMIALNVPKDKVSAACKSAMELGAPTKFVYKDTSMSTLKDYLSRTNHPGSPNVTVLNFIKWYHGSRGFENAVEGLGIKASVANTLEEFCEPLGIFVKRE